MKYVGMNRKDRTVRMVEINGKYRTVPMVRMNRKDGWDECE